jgi:hypothetical protein
MAEQKIITMDGEIISQEALDGVIQGMPTLLLRDETLGTDIMYTGYKLKKVYERNENGENVATDIVDARRVRIMSELFPEGTDILIPADVPTEKIKFKEAVKFKNLQSKPYVNSNGGFNRVEYRFIADGIIAESLKENKNPNHTSNPNQNQQEKRNA